MKRYIFIFILLASMVCTSCRYLDYDENSPYRIGFYNTTETDLYVDWSTEYPDTAITDMRALLMPDICKVKAYAFNNDALDLYSLFFKGKKALPSDTLMVYVFNASKLNKQDVPPEEALIARYDLSQEDLKKVNWILTYPPNDAMKGIKMWRK